MTQGVGNGRKRSRSSASQASSLSAGETPSMSWTASPSTRLLRGTRDKFRRHEPEPTGNFNDIKSVEVLKGAAATGIYGSRGANGVIMITTKRGTRKGLQVSYRSSYGAGRPRLGQHAEHRGISDHPTRGLGKRRGHGLRLASPTLAPPPSPLQKPENWLLSAMQTDTDWWDVFTRTSQNRTKPEFSRWGEKWSMFNSVSISDNESYAVGNSYNQQAVKTNSIGFLPTS